MKFNEELQYLAKCCGVNPEVVKAICVEVERNNPFRDDDAKFYEASNKFWALVH